MTTSTRPQVVPNLLLSLFPDDTLVGPDHPASQQADPRLLGGKAAALARLYAAGLPVPPYLVVTTTGARAAMEDAIWLQLGKAVDAQAAAVALEGAALLTSVAAALEAALVKLAPGTAHFAVRSSAVEEDSGAHSFAGQLASFLNVPPAQVAARVVDVWRSAFSSSVYAYRRERGLSGPPQLPAVLIQPMIPAEAAGVAFSADPVSGRRGVAVVAAVRGLADQLVAGAESGDSWQVDRQGMILRQEVADPKQPVMDEAMVKRVAALARRCANFFASPQDIEWAVAGGELVLLQSRPITTLAALHDPDGLYTLWDNSNIIESYGGMTTPLTYSFARRAYQAVYQELCRILGVSRPLIQANQGVFANMIGLVHGRIYYNLLNWYRVLALLPGFKANRRFMEQMMGVKESLPPEIVAGLAQASWRDRLADRLHLARTVVGLLSAYAGLGGRQQRFYARLERALGKGTPDLSDWRADELVAYYRRLESDLLPHWDAPLVNDFFAMIFYGLLRQLTASWCGDNEGTLQNDLLTGQGGMISAEPAGRVREMAALARAAQSYDPGFLQILASSDLRAIDHALASHPTFAASYRQYLDLFGERCLHELKLESATLHDNPLPLLHAVAQLAQQPPSLNAPDAAALAARTAAEARVDRALAGKPFRRALFGWVVKNARQRVVARENLRFARTRVFGRARQILRELGKRLYGAGALADPADVFYLTVDEVCGWVEGTTVGTDMAGLVTVRKREYEKWAEEAPLPPRFATYGAVYEGNRFEATGAVATSLLEPGGDDLVLRATGAAPGRVVGRVRLVRDPLTAKLNAGEIIVAEHTDPSWIMILPLAGGLVVERGSLLSHAAIVARELGIPAIVAATGALAGLVEGEMVEVDGGAGTVRRIGDAAQG
ncbi:MAG: phosphoenolpyruvate synthase [Caldilineaceae bacterium]|nr:phosphoenolpyruvate synthase [Caldilineaceae bacterium]